MGGKKKSQLSLLRIKQQMLSRIESCTGEAVTKEKTIKERGIRLVCERPGEQENKTAYSLDLTRLAAPCPGSAGDWHRARPAKGHLGISEAGMGLPSFTLLQCELSHNPGGRLTPTRTLFTLALSAACPLALGNHVVPDC